MFIRLKEIFKVIILAFVEGISEWLPISSSGHMLLVDEFIKLDASESFKEFFFVFIQLGAILAVVVVFFKKLLPFKKENKKLIIDKKIVSIWLKVALACLPGAFVSLLFDDYIEAHLHTPIIIALMLIIYGIAFIFIERKNKTKEFKIKRMEDLSYKTAFLIGLFQVLSIIPGTSRSGATILGALLLGVNRVVASEFSFYLAIPVMFGLSFLKLLKFGFYFSLDELSILLIGVIVAFSISLLVIKFMMKYLKSHDFQIFGLYRIILGVIVLSYFLFI